MKLIPINTRVLLEVVHDTMKGIVLPDGNKEKVKYKLVAIGPKVPKDIGLTLDRFVAMKPNTYIVGHKDFKEPTEFLLVDYMDIWGHIT